MKEVIIDTLIDSLKLLPFLFLTYLIMEWLEHRTGDRVRRVIQKSGKLGPLAGGLLGIVPQCGFSAAAANLYAGRIITLGTLVAIFLSTSDEMLPILISESVPVKTMVLILGYKAAVGVLAGLVVDLLLCRKKKQELQIEKLCEHEHCHCENGILVSACSHTLKIFVFIVLINFVISCIMHYVGEEALSRLVFNVPVAGVLLSGLIGMIPNCAASVFITQLYLQGAMGFGAMMAGLLAGAGVGNLVLCRVNGDKRECVRILALLYGIGVAVGLLTELIEKIR